jgi:uncharacterized phage protein gp47/JayE
MAFRVKDFDDIVSDMVAYIVANADEISDLTPGSVIRSYAEASALAVEELYVSTYLEFLNFLQTMKPQIFEFERKTGTKATASVVFARTGTSGLVSIPVGTTVATSADLEFVTTEAGEIADGSSTSTSIEVEASKVGDKYNVPADAIDTIVDDVDGVDSIDSSTAATGGVNIESDLQYNNRFQAFVEGLGRANVAGLEAGALEIDGITSVSVVEIFPPSAPDYQTVDLYVDDGSPTGVSTAKIAEVQSQIDGDGTAENPGYRAAGIRVLVQKPQVVTQPVAITVTPVSGVDTEQVATDIETAVTAYVNALGVGADIILNALRREAMEVFGVYDIDITDPTDNVTINATQVGRLSDISITFA